MKLSELKKIFPEIEIFLDAEFNALGMATSTYETKKVLSFLLEEKYFDIVVNNKNITAVITTKELSSKIADKNIGVLLSANPKKTFYEIHNMLAINSFYWKPFKNKIDKTALISNNAIISSNSVEIGKNSIIEDGVMINPGVIIGDNVIVRSRTILGTTGFQFYNDVDKVLNVITAGKLIIQDDVEIQHNCSIDKGVLGGNTIIKKNVRVDKHVFIAHDCVIGENTFIVAGSIVGGRTIIGKNCWLGINSTISNGLIIGDNVRVSLGAVVTRNVKDNSVVSGNFAIEHNKFIEFIKSIR